MKTTIKNLAEYLGISSEAVATIAVSLIVFLLGVLLNYLIHQGRAFQERKLTRKISKINHLLIIKVLVREALNFKGFGEQLTIDQRGSFKYRWGSIPAIDIYKEIGYPALYKAYFTGLENFSIFSKQKRLKAFNDLWLTIEFISINHSDSKDKGDAYIKRNGELNEAMNLATGKAQALIEEFRIRFNEQLGANEDLGVFFCEREKIIAAFATEENKTPTKTIKYFNDIIDLNRRNLSLLTRYNSDIKPTELNSYILESNYRYDSMKSHLGSANYYYTSISESYIKSQKLLLSSFKVLNIGMIYKVSKKSKALIRKEIKAHDTELIF